MEGVGPWDLFLWSVSSDYWAVSSGQLVTLGYLSLQATVIRCVWAAVRHGNGVRFLLLTWGALDRGNNLVTDVVVLTFLRPSESDIYRITQNCCQIYVYLPFCAVMGYEMYTSSFVWV